MSCSFFKACCWLSWRSAAPSLRLTRWRCPSARARSPTVTRTSSFASRCFSRHWPYATRSRTKSTWTKVWILEVRWRDGVYFQKGKKSWSQTKISFHMHVLFSSIPICTNTHFLFPFFFLNQISPSFVYFLFFSLFLVFPPLLQMFFFQHHIVHVLLSCSYTSVLICLFLLLCCVTKGPVPTYGEFGRLNTLSSTLFSFSVFFLSHCCCFELNMLSWDVRR